MLAQHSSESCEDLRRALKPSCLAGLLAAFLVRAAQELSCIFLKKVGPVSDIDIGDIVTDGEEVVGHAAVKCAGSVPSAAALSPYSSSRCTSAHRSTRLRWSQASSNPLTCGTPHVTSGNTGHGSESLLERRTQFHITLLPQHMSFSPRPNPGRPTPGLFLGFRLPPVLCWKLRCVPELRNYSSC